MTSATEFIHKKFNSERTQQELKSLASGDLYDWKERTGETITRFAPKSKELAKFICDVVPNRLNAPRSLLSRFESLKSQLPEEVTLSSDFSDFETLLKISNELTGNLESQQVSAEIQRQILNFEDFGSSILSNGNSIYPDFYYADYDYSKLPTQDRRKTVHGPCLQGKIEQRPSNVPDGIELKTNRSQRMRIDAHAPHIGLHLGFTWNFQDDGKVEINGAWLGFITESDHKESARNSKTTTVKYSFGHDKFISLLD